MTFRTGWPGSRWINLERFGRRAFCAQDPPFGTRFHYSLDNDVLVDILGRNWTRLCLSVPILWLIWKQFTYKHKSSDFVWTSRSKLDPRLLHVLTATFRMFILNYYYHYYTILVVLRWHPRQHGNVNLTFALTFTYERFFLRYFARLFTSIYVYFLTKNVSGTLEI